MDAILIHPCCNTVLAKAYLLCYGTDGEKLSLMPIRAFRVIEADTEILQSQIVVAKPVRAKANVGYPRIPQSCVSSLIEGDGFPCCRGATTGSLLEERDWLSIGYTVAMKGYEHALR